MSRSILNVTVVISGVLAVDKTEQGEHTARLQRDSLKFVPLTTVIKATNDGEADEEMEKKSLMSQYCLVENLARLLEQEVRAYGGEMEQQPVAGAKA